MDALLYCQAMEAFCRQQSEFEDQSEDFWLREAQSWLDRSTALARKRSSSPVLKIVESASVRPLDRTRLFSKPEGGVADDASITP